MPTEQIGLWLKPGTIAALKAAAKHRGVTYSALVDELVERGLTEDTAARMEERAVPVFTAAAQGVMAEQLRRFERRLTRRLAGLERNAHMASRIGYVHLYRDHPDEAEADWQEATEQMEMDLREGSPLVPMDAGTRAADVAEG